MLITSAVVSFQWPLPPDGFQWRDLRPVSDSWSVERKSDRVLVSNDFRMSFLGLNTKSIKYQPLDSSGLFRELAALDPSPEAIQQFANRYGALTGGRLFVPQDKEERMLKPTSDVRLSRYYEEALFAGMTEAKTTIKHWVMRGAVFGDSLGYWREEIHKLRALIGLWDSLRNSNRSGIEKFAQFGWNGKLRTINVVDEDGKALARVRTFTQEASAKLTLAAAAEHALTDVLSDLTANTSGILLFPHESRYRRKLAIVPKSLRDAIWLQFALAVLENKKYRSCEVCGKSFEVSPQVARTTRTLCSSACKQKAHRLRRDQCVKFAEQGLTAKQIAKRVGSQLSTVENWLQEFKEKK
ncbi:hypothetical protein ETAA8_36090 [Anatilimnocola aggregata]|uniref:Uncharacterized protein n=1 Tax=Anatilimnocola aggregata TaxID=2528021 RepID=A0A517YE73_9BACT|nr:hypothetical protein [Anatilimnocola aggregata]QDU28507.1 hypothetical protein ETAA8_36090 [Anatilimnocola aggregata]